MILARFRAQPDGIFGHLMTDDGGIVCVTLEHSYRVPERDEFQPKLPPGTYSCFRGRHRLHGMTEDFETFEVACVPGHTGILFHWGNWNRDSQGCILVGQAITTTPGGDMITSSRATFKRVMALWDGQKRFELTVTAATDWL